MPITGTIHIGDRLSYQDMANPRQVGTVKALEGTAVVVVEWDESGEKVWSDCRQYGWNRVEDSSRREP